MTQAKANEGEVRAALAQACQRIGREVPRWTQGAGGNVSIKRDGALWIKSSGCRLDQVGLAKSMARLPLQRFCEGLRGELARSGQAETDYAVMLAELGDPRYGRASMESGFHALLPRAFVAHFHALAALVMAHAAQHEPVRWGRFCRSLEMGNIPLLPPIQPGLLLGYAIESVGDFEFCLLANHGVILHGEDMQVVEKWCKFERAFCEAWEVSHLAAKGNEVLAAAYCSGPWHIYFPDAAVFCDRIDAITRHVPGHTRVLCDDAVARDRDAVELWVATQMLHEMCPSLAVLPEEIAASLADLPTEIWRRQRQLPTARVNS